MAENIGNFKKDLRKTIIGPWSVVNEGKCQRCVLNCPIDYEPICISRNGLNYTIINQCHLDYAVCRNKQSDFTILGKGECASVLKSISQTTMPSPTPHEVHSPRHARKILESSAQLEKIKAPVEIVGVPKTSSEISDKKSVKYKSGTGKSFTSKTAKKPAARKSHIMNLWRSSKKRRSRIAKKK